MAEVVANLQKEKTTATHERGSRELGPQPLALGPEAGLLALQATVGNRAVGKFLESMSHASDSTGILVQRKCTSCGQSASTCSGCHDEEEKIQRKPNGNGNGAVAEAGTVPPVVQQALTSGSGRSIDSSVKGMMESRFNRDFSHVRVHHDALANRAAASINAAAFTVGNSIWFGQGQYQTGTNRGLYLLAHELAHTVQQRRNSPAIQGRLKIGAVHDAAEAAADRAADAVISNVRVPTLSVGGPVIRRQPTNVPTPAQAAQQATARITDSSDRNNIEVEYQGDNYRVRRHVTGSHLVCEDVPDDESRISTDFDSSNAWVQIEWCTTRGATTTRGRVRFGADAPAALREAIEGLLNRGQDPRTLLNNFDITPFVEVDVRRTGPLRVQVETGVTVRPATPEVRGGRVTVRVGTSSRVGFFFEFSATAPETPGGRPDIRGTGGLTVELDRPDPVRCRQKRVCRRVPDYELRCVQHIPRQEIPHQEDHSLYFEYATDVVATRNSTTGRNRRAENNRAADQNASEIPRIQALIDQGWQVSSIIGFTSPEGPRPRPEERTGRGRENPFIGNNELSNQRATAARTFIQGLCNPNGLLTMRPRTCFIPDPLVVGRGELLTADRPRGGELEGTPLATQARTRFPLEEPTRDTPELEAELSRSTPRQQASLMYPLLRRADIKFTRTEVIPARDAPEGDCPAEVSRTVREFLDAPRSGSRR